VRVRHAAEALAVICGALLAACSSAAPPAPRASRPPDVPASAPRASPASSVPTAAPHADERTATCASSAVPLALTAYDDIVDGRAFSLELERSLSGAWAPVPPLRMPLHHASTIAWIGQQQLDAQATSRVLVVATGIGTPQIEHDAARHTWFATYSARVDRVCAANP